MKAALATSLALIALVCTAHAQAPAADPIRCWWRTSVGAIATGEPFDATLTCAVREQATVRTVPDESRLAAAAVQLSPFEVIGGSHPADLRSDAHRFFQYHYTVRIIDRDAIGRDARFPDQQIRYRVHTLVNGEWTQGRDRTYILPGRAIRVLSLVPADEDDIRDSGDESFARVEALHFRTRALRIAAAVLVLLGVILAVPVAVRAVQRTRRAPETNQSHLSRSGAVRAVNGELTRIAVERGGGWSPELAGRTLTALRLLAACALKRPVAQRALAAGDVPPNALAARHGWLRKQRVALSSATTARDVEAALNALPSTASAVQRDALERLRDAIQVFTRAVYGADGALDGASLDKAFDEAREAAGRVKGRGR